MRKNTVVYDFTRFSIPTLLTFVDGVIECLTGNQNFQQTQALLEQLRNCEAELRAHNLASQKGNREESALARQSKAELIKLLKKLANIVDDVADGNEAIILNSGFHMAKPASVGTRALLSAEAGEQPGSVIVRRQADPDACSYLWEKSIDGITWEFAGVSGVTRHVITGLKSVTRYYFRVAVVTSEGTTAFSEAISQIVE